MKTGIMKRGLVGIIVSIALLASYLPAQSSALVPSNFTSIAKEANEFMVNIYTTQVIERRLIGPDEMFRFFFGNQFRHFFQGMPKKFKRRSLGSGFIIDKKGYILTNNHVVKGATEIKVKLHDGSTHDAKLIGSDSKTDIALIKIDPKGTKLVAAKLGDSDKAEIGQWVLAVGNPFGLSYTVTAGIISAKGRVIGEGPYDNFIQTDASINPGNSGGPLINMNGEVIGINTAIVAQGQGIGFAIPINMAKEILPQLKTKGRVTRGWLGVYVQALTQELAKSFGIKETHGAVVTQVIENSPADKGGIKEGDIITEFNGKKIKEMRELPHYVAITPPGTKVKIKVLRNGKEKLLNVKVGVMPEEEASLGGVEGSKKAELGLKVAPIPPDITAETGVKGGVYVTEVDPGSPADQTGIQQGDIILRVNRKRVTDLSDFNKALSKIKPGEIVAFLIRRGDSSFYVAIRMQ
jgi:serine protease Do